MTNLIGDQKRGTVWDHFSFEHSKSFVEVHAFINSYLNSFTSKETIWGYIKK